VGRGAQAVKNAGGSQRKGAAADGCESRTPAQRAANGCP
jgi:hypothetical protein